MHRREFLASAAVATIASVADPIRAASPGRQWRLAPEPGLFECDQVASVADQMRFAADRGFRAFVDDGWLQRSRSERAELQSAARDLGLTLGPFRASAESLRDWDTLFDETESIGVQAVRVEISSAALSDADLSASLDFAARTAGERSLTLLLEPRSMSSDLASFVAEDHPGLQLSVDIYRLASSGHNVGRWLNRYLPWIGHIELADFPGGLEPGTGRLDIPRLCTLLDEHGYSGVVGLRHGRSQPGRAGIDAVLRACQRIDPSITL